MITGTLRPRYIIASVVFFCLYCLCAVSMFLLGSYGWTGWWFLASFFGLLYGFITVGYIVSVVRQVRWFRLADGVLTYRKLISSQERTLPITQIRRLELVWRAKPARVIGFNIVTEPNGHRLFFSFERGFYTRELLQELSGHKEVVDRG